MIILDIPQLSDDWFEYKAFAPSASNFDKIITTKGEPSKQREAYLYKLAGCRVIGRTEETYTSWSMQRGIDIESEARKFFELIMGVDVEQVGLIFKDKDKKACCSPDGLLNDRKDGLEIKCPEMHTHVKYLLDNKLPTTYFQQVQGSLYVCNLDKWLFMSYYPELPPLIVEVGRDEKFIFALNNEIERFCEDLEKMVEEIRNK